MKYDCHFLNPDTGELKAVIAALSQAQVEAITKMRAAGDENADVHAQACALSVAYAEVPRGFRHTEPPALVELQ